MKLVASGFMLGGEMELAGAISRKAQEADNGAQYISITDLGPSIAQFYSVDANTNRSTKPWLFETRNPFGILIFLLAITIILTCSLCWIMLVL